MNRVDPLKIGMSINIQRTDGRVHSATIAAVDHNMSIATVEWHEQGETKGKEIDLMAVEALNPALFVKKPRTKLPIPESESVRSNVSSNRQTFPLSINESKPSILITTNQMRQKLIQPDTSKKNSDNSTASYKLPTNKESRILTSRVNIDHGRRNTLQVVEKLKKNREERRSRQSDLRSERGNTHPYSDLISMITEFRRSLDIKPITENDLIEDHLITVCVRKRPLNRREISRKEVDVITVPNKNQLIVHEPKNKVDLTKYLDNHVFRFDYVFDACCSNEIIYRYTAQPLIKTVFDGGFATCFAYGQTGAGKTHTMGGDFNGKQQNCEKGIYAMVTSDIFRSMHSSRYNHLNLTIFASFFEIYSGKIYDLLNEKQRLKMLEDGKQQVQVVGLTEKMVRTTDDVLKLIQKGNLARTSGQTFANTNSSRSHAIFQLHLKNGNRIHGKYSLIDLAGNERGADTSSDDRQTRMEGAEINKSLLALKECIRALGKKGAHLPFRVSKLTQVLRDSFVGSNSRTCMIAMVSPSVGCCEHTLNTLRYADRVKELESGDVSTNPADEQDMMYLHQMTTELQNAEDDMLDTHKQTIKDLISTCDRAEKLLKMADGVAYDQDIYCRTWEELIDKSLASLLHSKEVVAVYKAKLMMDNNTINRIRKQ